MKKTMITCSLLAMILSVSIILFNGCAMFFPPSPPPIPAERVAYWQEEAAKPVTCNAGKDCELKWSRCLEWVQSNSHWKLRNVNDFIITTEGPLDTGYPSYSITKKPEPDGSYSINFSGGCGVLGCYTDMRYLKAHFVNFINGTPFINKYQ